MLKMFPRRKCRRSSRLEEKLWASMCGISETANSPCAPRSHIDVSLAVVASLFHLLPDLRLVLDHVEPDDACIAALTCRAFRDTIFERFPERTDGRARLSSRLVANVSTKRRVAWAISAGCAADRLPAAAAQMGRLRQLEWLTEWLYSAHGWGQPWRANSFLFNQALVGASRGGQLKVLQWLKERVAADKSAGGRGAFDLRRYGTPQMCEAAAAAGATPPPLPRPPSHLTQLRRTVHPVCRHRRSPTLASALHGIGRLPHLARC